MKRANPDNASLREDHVRRRQPNQEDSPRRDPPATAHDTNSSAAAHRPTTEAQIALATATGHTTAAPPGMQRALGESTGYGVADLASFQPATPSTHGIAPETNNCAEGIGSMSSAVMRPDGDATPRSTRAGNRRSTVDSSPVVFQRHPRPTEGISQQLPVSPQGRGLRDSRSPTGGLNEMLLDEPGHRIAYSNVGTTTPRRRPKSPGATEPFSGPVPVDKELEPEEQEESANSDEEDEVPVVRYVIPEPEPEENDNSDDVQVLGYTINIPSSTSSEARRSYTVVYASAANVPAGTLSRMAGRVVDGSFTVIHGHPPVSVEEEDQEAVQQSDAQPTAEGLVTAEEAEETALGIGVPGNVEPVASGTQLFGCLDRRQSTPPGQMNVAVEVQPMEDVAGDEPDYGPVEDQWDYADAFSDTTEEEPQVPSDAFSSTSPEDSTDDQSDEL